MASELVLVDLDLNGNALIRASLEALASAPGNPTARQMYFDTTLDSPVVRNFDNTGWITLNPRKASNVPLSTLAVDPLARANHTGTQSSTTISDFHTAVRTNRLDQLAAPTAAVSMNSQKITDIADPVNNNDATNRKWVIDQIQAMAAGIDSKPSVRYSTTGNVNLYGLGTQAGGDWPSSMSTDTEILVKNQTNASENGIYVAKSGAWQRRSDANSSTTLTSGSFVVVEDGTTLQATSWILATPGPINLNVTNQTWNQFGASAVYTAGNGLNLSGNQFSVKPATSGGIKVDSAGVAVDNTVARVITAKQIIGDDSTTSFTFTHNLNKRGFPVFVTEFAAPYRIVYPGIRYDTMNTVTITFNTAPASGTNYYVDWVG